MRRSQDPSSVDQRVEAAEGLDRLGDARLHRLLAGNVDGHRAQPIAVWVGLGHRVLQPGLADVRRDYPAAFVQYAQDGRLPDARPTAGDEDTTIRVSLKRCHGAIFA